jgi:RNA polymerase sigma factor for flagellar operon FliA
MARKLAAQFGCPHETQDLVSTGFESLLRSIPELSSVHYRRHRSFLKNRMHHAMIRAIQQYDHLSRAERRALVRMERLSASAEAHAGHELGPAALANAAGVKPEVALRVYRLTGLIGGSLAPRDGGAYPDHASTGGVLAEVLDSEGRDPLALLLSAENTLLVEQALDRLPDREHDAIVGTFYDGLTLKQVGAMLGVTEARASQLRSTGLRRMRKFLQRFQ